MVARIPIFFGENPFEYLRNLPENSNSIGTVKQTNNQIDSHPISSDDATSEKSKLTYV